MRAPRLLSITALAIVAGCSAPSEDEELDRSQSPLTAVCDANVRGVGLVPTEDQYLANVVHCENGGAPFEALKAQAIAARTYLYYKMETSGSIADGTGDQVYSCGAGPTAEQIKAVKDTAGQVLRYKGVTVCAFYVAGGAASPPACRGSTSASTEQYVTYNEGKSGTGITQTTLGWVSPTNNRNRGCLSQLGSRCLANSGKTAEEILRFYYGEDIVIETAVGPCVPTVAPDASADTTPAPDTGAVDTASTPDDAAVEDAATSDTGASADATSPLDPASDRVGDEEFAGSCSCSTPGSPERRAEGALLCLALGALTLRSRARARRTLPRTTPC